MPTYINIDPTKMFRQYFFEAPVDENNTKIFFLNMRNFLLDPKNNGPIHARNKVIAQQDIEILTDLYPLRTPISNTKEVLMPADKAVVAYRDWLAKFDDKGWRIDWDEFKQVLAGNGPCNRDRMAARRKAHEDGAWVREAALAYAEKRRQRSALQAAE